MDNQDDNQNKGDDDSGDNKGTDIQPENSNPGTEKQSEIKDKGDEVPQVDSNKGKGTEDKPKDTNTSSSFFGSGTGSYQRTEQLRKCDWYLCNYLVSKPYLYTVQDKVFCSQSCRGKYLGN